MKEYKKGDVVWYMEKYSDNMIAVETTIKNVDDYYRKQNKNAYLFYDLDVVVGHDVTSDELLNTREECEEYFEQSREEYKKESAIEPINFKKWQEEKRKFVISTWEYNDMSHPGFDKTIKESEKGWFTLKQYIEENK